jgi:isoleucyl-tRNA synthetase
MLKDRLYTLGTRHPLRRSSQTAIHEIFGVLVRILAPVIPFTADEAWSFARSGTEFGADSVHLQDWPEIPPSWSPQGADAGMASLIKMRAKVNEAIEPLRAAGRIGKSLDAAVTLRVPAGDPLRPALEGHLASLPEIFIVSEVNLELPRERPGAFGVEVRACSEAGLARCPRCWRWLPGLEQTQLGEVCPRCAETLKS